MASVWLFDILWCLENIEPTSSIFPSYNIYALRHEGISDVLLKLFCYLCRNNVQFIEDFNYAISTFYL